MANIKQTDTNLWDTGMNAMAAPYPQPPVKMPPKKLKNDEAIKKAFGVPIRKPVPLLPFSSLPGLRSDQVEASRSARAYLEEFVTYGGSNGGKLEDVYLAQFEISTTRNGAFIFVFSYKEPFHATSFYGRTYKTICVTPYPPYDFLGMENGDFGIGNRAGGGYFGGATMSF